MPTTVSTFAFSGGQNAIPGYGDRWQVGFSGTWLFNDNWTVAVTSSEGDFTVGVGNLHGLLPTVAFTYRNREYLGMGSQFNFSGNGDPTKWEEQDPGAGFVEYLSNFGTQDSIIALNQLQGRLAVFGRLSVQIWTVDADPNLFTLVQTLDNTGTDSKLSAQNLGDYDVLYLDPTGVRSLKAKEVTLNADVDDVGLPVDSLIQAALQGYDPTLACAIVEPTSKRYWLFVNGTIFVLSRYRSSKISAWATYLPTVESLTAPGGIRVDTSSTVSHITGLTLGVVYYYSQAGSATLVAGGTTLTTSGYFVTDDTTALINGSGATASLLNIVAQTAFVPEKFVVHNRRVYCRTVARQLLLYGGLDNLTYDRSVATIITPWLDDKSPATIKTGQGIDAVIEGAWTVQAGTDPQSGLLKVVLVSGDGVTPNANSDSTFDGGRIPFESVGTHFKVEAATSPFYATKATFSSIVYHYNRANVL